MRSLTYPEGIMSGDIIGTGAAGIGAAAWAAKRVFGSSLDAVNDALGRWTEHALRNVGRVVENAESKIPDERRDDGMPLRFAMRVMNESAYAESDLEVEYLGGVLASGRTPSGRDDRGVVFSGIVSRMSSYQLRLHYVIYTTMRRLYAGEQINFGYVEAVEPYEIFIPSYEIAAAIDASEDEDWQVLSSHALHGLNREGLIGREWFTGPAEEIRVRSTMVDPPSGLLVGPSPMGVELYLWAVGKGQLPIEAFTSLTEDDEFETDVKMPKLAQIVGQPDPED